MNAERGHNLVRRWSSILMYHSVCAAPPTRDFAAYVVTPATLERHLEALRASGYLVNSLSDHMQASWGTRGDATASVCLTFDDGFRDFVTDVLPMLDRYGARASLFVPTGYVGGTAQWLAPEGEADRPMLGWAEIEEIASSGIVEIGAHSHAHPQLDLLDAARRRAEVTLPKTILEDRLQLGIHTFAYPFGYHRSADRHAVEAAGYRWAVEVGERQLTSADGSMALPRLTVTPTTSAEQLLTRLQTPPTSYARAVSTAKRHIWRVKRVLDRIPATPPAHLPPLAAGRLAGTPPGPSITSP